MPIVCSQPSLNVSREFRRFFGVGVGMRKMWIHAICRHVYRNHVYYCVRDEALVRKLGTNYSDTIAKEEPSSTCCTNAVGMSERK